MNNNRGYLIEQEFFENGVKAIFTKKELFSSSYFLMMNEKSRESFINLESVLKKEEGITINNLFVPNAEHTSNIVNLDNNSAYKYAVYGKSRDVLLSMPKELCDAIYTRDASKNLIIMPGDCMVIALIDEKAGVKGILHAGWRGLIDGVIVNTIEMFKEKGADVKNIKGILFPSVSMECYDLEEETIERFKKFAKELGLKESEVISYNNNGRYNIALRKFALAQIKKLGIKDENMKEMDYCTYSTKEKNGSLKFHSHRRDKTLSMNMALFLGKK